MAERVAEVGGTLQAGPTPTGGGSGKPAIGAGMTIRVLIADDHPLVRQGLQAALAPMPDVEVVAEAATGQAAIREAPAPARCGCHGPADARPERDRRHQLGRTLPTAAVLVLTMFDDDDWVFAAMRAGARGYVLKGAEHHEIARHHAVAAGEAIFLRLRHPGAGHWPPHPAPRRSSGAHRPRT